MISAFKTRAGYYPNIYDYILINQWFLKAES